MRFKMNMDEIVFIQKTFHFPPLLCVNHRADCNESVAKQLEERGVIENKGSYYELNVEYRLLFQRWAQMQISMLRPSETLLQTMHCIMTDSNAILVFTKEEETILLDFYDFDPYVMDTLIGTLLRVDVSVGCEHPFILPLSVENANAFLSAATEDEMISWQNKTGILAELLSFYRMTICESQASEMVLLEDHVKKIGCMVKLVNTARGIVAAKHITPEDPTHSRVVLVLGDAKYVVDSIYNL